MKMKSAYSLFDGDKEYRDVTLAQARKLVPWRLLRLARRRAVRLGDPRGFAVGPDGDIVEVDVEATR